MSSLIFAHAKQIVQKCEKLSGTIADRDEQLGKNWKESYTNAYNCHYNSELLAFDKYLNVAAELHERYGNICKRTKNSYFITIRPSELLTNFNDFFTQIQAFANRKSFLRVKYSFEQKGTCPSEIGRGFHSHLIVYETRIRSKGEMIRATLSSFNKWIEKGLITPNCIDVQTTSNPDDILNKYLIAYESDDQHKKATKAMDELWRLEKGIEHIYECSASPSAIGPA